ncbi:MAG: acyl-CoA dehydrogenase family protein [Thermoprotei archaeon]|nr:acyl-CoA dehydrogenase family protein [Thermoprotei archaeon]
MKTHRYPLPPEYLNVYNVVREFAASREHLLLKLDRASHEEVMGEIRRILRESSSIRLLSMPIPGDLGGSGYFTLGATVALEALAFHDAGLATTVGAVWLGLLPPVIANMLGRGDVGERWLRPFAEADARGEPQVWAFAITEPTAGSDYERLEPGAPQPEFLTYARREGEYWVISGRKIFISNGPIADYVTVFALTDRLKGVESMACFVVPREAEGFRVFSVIDKMGHRSSPTGELAFESVRVPEDHMVCPPGLGWDSVQLTLAYSRAPVGGIALGIAKRAYREALNYAKSRIQGGRRIAEHQIVREKLANMYIMIAAAESLVYSVVSRLESEFPPPMDDSSAAKVFASDVAVHASLEAVQIMGGYGYTRDFIVEKLVRDAKLTQIYEGTNEVNRLTISDKILSEV